MSITTERKAEVIKSNQTSANDTGSPEVQIAILTERITNLAAHMQHQQKRRLQPPWPFDHGCQPS
jgi:small subunit ribosomal protein S15